MHNQRIFKKLKRIIYHIFFLMMSVLILQCILASYCLASVLSFASFPSRLFLHLRGQDDPSISIDQTLSDYKPDKKNVCVVGGGFGGLYTALGISRNLKAGFNVYLIDPKDRFVFLPLLYELTVGSASPTEVAPLFRDLLAGSKIKFIKGSVEDIDFNRRLCMVSERSDDGTGAISTHTRQIEYDQIVLAAGNQPRLDFIPGAAQYSIPFYRLEDCYRLKSRLAQLKSSKSNKFIRAVVIGASYSGVELATNIADYFGRNHCAIKVVDRGAKMLPTAATFNRDVAERAVAYQGISVAYNTSIKEVVANGVHLIDETGADYFVEADIVLCTAGSEQSPLVKRFSLKKNRSGRLLTRDTLQSVEYDNVFCLGDCAVIEGDELPGTAQVALQQAGTVAHNILQLQCHNAAGNRLKSFKYFSLGEMLSLGTLDATISSLGGLVQLSGPLAAIGRRAIYAVRMPTTLQTVKALVTASATTTGKIWKDIFGSTKNT